MRTANVLVSLAGPLSNIILALIVMIIFKILIVAGALSGDTAVYIAFGMEQIIQINIFLGIFNLIPIPPFDGYHILAGFLPAKAVYFMEKNGQIIHFIVFVLLISDVLDRPLMFLEMGVYNFLDIITRFIC